MKVLRASYGPGGVSEGDGGGAVDDEELEASLESIVDLRNLAAFRENFYLVRVGGGLLVIVRACVYVSASCLLSFYLFF